MQILTGQKNKRTILTLLGSNEQSAEILECLESIYRVVSCENVDECLRIVDERYADLSAIIASVELAVANDYELLRRAANESNAGTIPIVLTSTTALSESDLRCLDEGAVDFIRLPNYAPVIEKRIENAIRLKQSTTFVELESMLCQLPSNIFLKDVKGRYVFCTHYWHHFDTKGDPNWTVYGKTDLEIRRDLDNALKAVESDQEIVRTGVGCEYVLESNLDGIHDFKQLIKRPVFDSNGNVTGIIALINDVTENELLKRELQVRAVTDDLTGISNRRSFNEYVAGIPDRTDFPMAVISADCDGLKKINDTFGHLAGDDYLRNAVAVFKRVLPESASVFRTGGDEFVVFVPGTSKEQTDEMLVEMRRQQEQCVLEYGTLSISYGASVLNGPSANITAAIAQADHDMYLDKAARKRARG